MPPIEIYERDPNYEAGCAFLVVRVIFTLGFIAGVLFVWINFGDEAVIWLSSQIK